MKKKRLFLLTLSVVAFLAFGGGALSLRNGTALAEDVPTKTGFYVENGASIRLKEEYENFGIRFAANVGEKVDGAIYNMLIVPAQLVDVYEKDVSPDKTDIVTYLEKYANDRNGKLSVVKDCNVSKDGMIVGSIINILWQNINRKFVGIAYYEKDGQITVAQYADDKERSVVDVSKKALDSGDYTELSDIKILLEKVRFGKMQESGATETDKQSKQWQYESFYGASIDGNTVITAADTSITLFGLTGEVGNNVLTLSSDNDSDNGVTINLGCIPVGTYRLGFSHTLKSGEFSSVITQNGNTRLATAWELNTDDNGLYELYFKQKSEENVSFTISSTKSGSVTLDDIFLEPVKVETLEYNREKYMFGIGGLATGINASEGSYCDSKVTSEWVSLAVNTLGVESQRVWMSIPQIINRAENSNELSINAGLASSFHNHFARLRTAGVKRIMVMLTRFVYPYDYEHCSSNCAPDPNKESSVYKTWLEMQYQAYKLLAKEFPEITFWECGNEQDLDTYLYKNGLKDTDSWSIGQSNKDYTFTNTEKAYITADLCYAASKAFKLYNPESKIIMPGMSSFAADKDGHPYATEKTYYFEDLYKHIESGKLPTLETTKITDPDEYFDIIAWHNYAESVSDFENVCDLFMQTAKNHGDGDKRIWITELGFTEGNFGGKGTDSAQNAIATLAGEILTSLEQEKYANLIETVFFFRLSDTVALGDGNESCFGIYNSPNASVNANKAKPLAVTLYNYFNKKSATAEDITFWKGSETSEDFENVLFGENLLMNVGPNITLTNCNGEIVEYNGGKALKVSVSGNGKYNSVAIDFSNVSVGKYKVSFTYKLLDGIYSGAIVADGDYNEFTYISATTALGNDNYCFYFTQETAGNKRFTFTGQQWNMCGIILLDNISLEQVDDIPIKIEFGRVENQNFDNVSIINGQTTDIGGVYLTYGKLNAELIADGQGGNALKVVKVGGGYSTILLSLGDLTKGNYRLTFDVLDGNFANILQMVNLKYVDGYWKQVVLQDSFLNSYATLDKLARKKGNTYTLSFSVSNDYSDLAMALVSSSSTIGEYIVIDNVKFERIVTNVIDFEGGANLDFNASQINGYTSNDKFDIIGFAATTDTLTAGYETSNGNTYYKVNFKGWGSWTKFNLGYLKAGTYTVTIDVTTINGTMNGNFVYNANGTQTNIVPTVENEKYTFTFTLDADCDDFYIGYVSVSGKNADFTLAFDNIYVTVGANIDGKITDSYDWLNGLE